VNCGGDLPLDLLYSVDLNGNNRLEANLPTIFSDDEFIAILEIHPLSNGSVYIATGSYNHTIPGDFPEIWRVLRISVPNQVELIVAPDQAAPIPITTGFSPDETRLALSSQWPNGYIVIVNLNSGQYTQLPTVIPDNICRIEWVDTEHILGTAYNDACDNLYRQPGATYVFDLQTGASDVVDLGLPGTSWFLPISQIPATQSN
jgi:hypothetical protein